MGSLSCAYLIFIQLRVVKRTEEEVQLQKKEFAEKTSEREQRRLEQEANVKRKAEEREQHRIRCGAKVPEADDPSKTTETASADGEERPAKTVRFR